MMNLRVTRREFHTLLAALRFYQEHGQCDPAGRPAWIQDIASNGGQVDPLDATGIDRLCERLNIDSQEGDEFV